MSMNCRRISSSQSSNMKKICALVVRDDPLHRIVLAEMLRFCCHYEALKFKNIVHVLHAICEKKDGFDAVVTDINRSDTNGAEIIEFIEKEIKLPVISISSNENKFGLTCTNVCAKLYFLETLSASKFTKLWEYALAREKSARRNSDRHWDDALRLDYEENRASRRRSRTNSRDQNQENGDDESENSSREDSNPSGKKKRILWTDTLHRKFLEAIEELGFDRAFPKRIAEIMDVPGLTRAHVASHLQKHKKSVIEAERQRLFNSPPGVCNPLFESSNSTNSVLHQQFLAARSNQRSLQHPYGHSFSPLGRPVGPNGQSSFDRGMLQSVPRLNLTQPEGPSSGTLMGTFVGFRLSGDEKSVLVGQVEPAPLEPNLETNGSYDIGSLNSGGSTQARSTRSFGSSQTVPEHHETILGSTDTFAKIGSFDSVLGDPAIPGSFDSGLGSTNECDIESLVSSLLDSVSPEQDLDPAQTAPACNHVIEEEEEEGNLPTEGSEEKRSLLIVEDSMQSISSLERDLESFLPATSNTIPHISSGGGFDATFFDNSN